MGERVSTTKGTIIAARTRRATRPPRVARSRRSSSRRRQALDDGRLDSDQPLALGVDLRLADDAAEQEGRGDRVEGGGDSSRDTTLGLQVFDDSSLVRRSSRMDSFIIPSLPPGVLARMERQNRRTAATHDVRPIFASVRQVGNRIAPATLMRRAASSASGCGGRLGAGSVRRNIGASCRLGTAPRQSAIYSGRASK